MILLSKEEIEKLIDPNEMMDQIEEAYRLYGENQFFMPPRPVIEHDNKSLIYMPCYTDDVIGTKILTIFPENSKLGLPSIDGVILLNNAVTGAPEALLDGQSVTAWRTGIIGAGAQGFHLALYACAARDIHTVYIYNHSDRDLTDFIARLEKAIDNPNTKVVWCKKTEELVKHSDIICTATPSAVPVLPNDKELLRGKCIIAIGSYTPEMREIPDAIWDLTDKVYIELPYACEEAGDLSQPIAEGRLKKEQAVLMSDFLKSDADEDQIAAGTTYFKSVGMALFDICVAQKLLAKSKEKQQ